MKKKDNNLTENNYRAATIAEDIIIFMGIAALITIMVTYKHPYYDIYATVVVSHEDVNGINKITFKDRDGDEWQWQSDGYSVGRRVKLTLYNNRTPKDKSDDSIIAITILDIDLDSERNIDSITNFYNSH